MTTRKAAEALLFNGTPLFNKGVPTSDLKPAKLPEPITTSPSPTRLRVCATYCPRCSGWVEVRLRPVQLRCTGCGLEARP